MFVPGGDSIKGSPSTRRTGPFRVPTVPLTGTKSRVELDPHARTMSRPKSESTLVKGRDEYIEIVTKEFKEPPWQQCPFSMPSYNPLTEWGEHYEKIFARDLWPKTSTFDV